MSSSAHEKAGKDVRQEFRAPVDASIQEAEEAAEQLEAASYSIRSLINDYCSDVLAPTKRGAERARMIRNDLEAWFHREAASIRRAEVSELVDTVSKRAPDIAGRVLRELRAAYRYALKRERIPDGIDPTHGVKAPSTYVPRDRAYTDGEWRKFLRWLPESGMSADVQDALMLESLTVCRPGEATSAVWRDIDLRAGTWIIRDRKRKGSAHVVFLSQPARALLKRRTNGGVGVSEPDAARSADTRTRARLVCC